MKRILSTVIVIALLLSLGALAVLARGGGDILTPAKSVPVAFAAPGVQEDTNTSVAVPDTQSKDAAAEAVAAVNKYNNLALPLNVHTGPGSQFPLPTGTGLPFTAFGLAKFIGAPGTEVLQVRHWNAANQVYQTCTLRATSPTTCFPSADYDFALENNGNYMVLVSSALIQTVASFVGDVPDAGSVHFNMVGKTPGCKWNAILLPLDQPAITNAVKLAASLGGTAVVSQLRSWSPLNQVFTTCSIHPSLGTCIGGESYNFPTQIGYPYWACLKVDKTWP